MKTLRVSRGTALLFQGLRHSRGGGDVSPMPRPPPPPEKTRYPLYRRLGELQGRSGRAENRPHRDWIPKRPVRSSVAIPTELLSPPGHGWEYNIKIDLITKGVTMWAALKSFKTITSRVICWAQHGNATSSCTEWSGVPSCECLETGLATRSEAADRYGKTLDII